MRVPKSHCFLGPNVYLLAPDGGWGWAVAVAFFIVEIFTYGTIKSLGVFLQDLMEEFGESNSRVSWVISICVFIFNFTAPLSTMLSTRFGHQSVVMTGGFLISLGTITSAFTNSINEMYLTIGVVSGFGYCLTFLPTVTVLAQYFSRRRALVTSIASSGESFAIFAFAPILTKLKEHIGWRYCLVILGMFQASVIGCGLLLRPIIIEPESEKKEDDSDRDSLYLKKMQGAYEIENQQTKISISSEVTFLPASNVDLSTTGTETTCLMECEFYEGQKMPLPTTPTIVMENEGLKMAEVEAGTLQPSISNLLNFSVLRDGAFVWYSLFGLFATLGFFAPQLYIIELSKSRGVDPSMASYMLSMIAVAEILGRLSFGVVLNKVCCKKTFLLLACVVLLCLVLVAFTVVWEFWGLVACSALYGYFMGAVGSTHIPMLAEEDVVGIQKMASTVGVYVFIQSFSGLAGPPLGGVLVDVTNNYGAAFYSSAVGMGLSAICLALVGPTKSGICRSQTKKDRQIHREKHTVSQYSYQADFIELQLAPEDSLVKKSKDHENGKYKYKITS